MKIVATSPSFSKNEKLQKEIYKYFPKAQLNLDGKKFNQKELVEFLGDADGVIKDSVSVKSDAFELLFLPFGDKVAKKVKKHHEENGGMSRYDKLPIYLNWAGEDSSKELICKFEQKFYQLVKKQVIKSPWVVGVLEYLQIYYKKQFFLL